MFKTDNAPHSPPGPTSVKTCQGFFATRAFFVRYSFLQVGGSYILYLAFSEVLSESSEMWGFGASLLASPS